MTPPDIGQHAPHSVIETLGAAFCALICSISQPGIYYTYGYASNTDNLTSEKREGGSYAGTVTYAYDSLGQLTRVNDPKDTRGGSTGTTWVYTYDRGGNILNKKKYAYTTGTVGTVQQTISFTYNSAWKDKLATYNGTTLTYDAIGNLTGDGTWTYTWAGGRQLSGMSKSGTSIAYAYDHSGLRVRKTVNGSAVNYRYTGGKLSHVYAPSYAMHFFYDGQGRASILRYSGNAYHYLYNLQGDVVGLVDTSGNIVVEYKYDAWGKLISKTGSLAGTVGLHNPFRYRGYVYDEETGLYYLRSRYYNPEWGRFVNADVLLGKRGALLSHNLFAYCTNNPVIKFDMSGRKSVYVNVYLNVQNAAMDIFGALGYRGHVDISIDDVTYTYGRYENERYPGKGVFVVKDRGSARRSMKREGHNMITFEMDMTDEEISELEKFFEWHTFVGTEYDPEGKSGRYLLTGYEYENYSLISRNCTTFALEALAHAYGEDFEKEFVQAFSFVPHILCANLIANAEGLSQGRRYVTSYELID